MTFRHKSVILLVSVPYIASDTWNKIIESLTNSRLTQVNKLTHKVSVSTLQRTRAIIKTSELMLRREIIINYYEDREKHITRHFERGWGLGRMHNLRLLQNIVTPRLWVAKKTTGINQLLRTVRPIYRTSIPLPSRCRILYIFFNKYKYWVF